MKNLSASLRRVFRAYPSLNLKININKTQNELDVVMPGLRFDDIDFTGHPIIWRILDMVNRVEHAAFYTSPSFLDYVTLYNENLTTIVKACKVEFVSDFYETVTPKAPLDISIALNHIGNTSFTTQSGITCGGSMKPFVKIQNMHTMINREKRNVQALPKWWKDKFMMENKEEEALNIVQSQKSKDTFLHVFAVPLSDTDVMHMTRCASYLRYFMENASIASRRGYYHNIKTSFHEFHIKKMDLLYIAHSCWGDELVSETWEDSDPLTLHCQVRKPTGEPVWYAKMQLYAEVFGLKL